MVRKLLFISSFQIRPMKLLPLIIFCWTLQLLYSQTDTIRMEKSKADFTIVDFPQIEADFPCLNIEQPTDIPDKPAFQEVCGARALNYFIAQNFVYPVDALEKNIHGKVLVSFVVLPNGELTNIKLVNGIHPTLDTEALRLISIMPLWIPALEYGLPCMSRVLLPINFTVN